MYLSFSYANTYNVYEDCGHPRITFCCLIYSTNFSEVPAVSIFMVDF
jgi:hypothetical protein